MSYLHALTVIFVLIGADGAIAANEQAPAAKASSAEDWKTLFPQKEKLIEKLTTLQQDYRKAKTPEEQDQVRKEFVSARKEFDTLYQRLIEMAPKVYAADPKNLDAGETAMEVVFQQNRFDESGKLADELLAAGRKNVLIVNVAGVSKFATHDFAAAKEILTAAKKDGLLHPQLGERYLEPAGEYIALWKAEQAIREKEAAAQGDAQLPRVLFKTNRGDILLELFENEAPNTVANFVSLVEGKKYDGVKFHRVLPMFMAQGGDPNSLDDNPDNDGQGGPGYTIKCECYTKNARKHFRGSLSMAKTAAPHTGGSQFFLTHLPTPHLNANVEAQTGHTVFGRIVEGLDVAASLQKDDKIVTATVARKRDHEYKPVTQPEAKQ